MGLLLTAALLLAMHTAFTAKDASLHLKLQHSKPRHISYLIFNICSMVGLVTLLALVPGALFAAFGLLVGDFLSDSRVSKKTCASSKSRASIK